MVKTSGAVKPRETGRPAGSRNPTAKAKIRRQLAGIYDATLKRALSGDADAARLCLEIAKTPDQFPDPENAETE